MLAHVIAMAHEMGLTCVLEGVEAEEPRKLTRDYGSGIAQGFLFDRLMPAEESENRLQNITSSMQNRKQGKHCEENIFNRFATVYFLYRRSTWRSNRYTHRNDI